MIDIADLKKQRLFSELNNVELDLMASKVILEKFAKGASIFKEGDPVNGIYLIRSGKIEVSKITADGWKQTLSVLSTNYIFGELSMIENRKTHSADATALEATEVYLLKAGDFREFEKTNMEMMYKVMRSIVLVACWNVHAMNEKLMKLLISY
jgi:CRP/FNR family cyclic AMP-dependent transcriptional regulator